MEANNDELLVAEYVIEYYRWLSGNGGTDPETLLFSSNLSSYQVELLKEGIDDINAVWAITAPLREANLLDMYVNN